MLKHPALAALYAVYFLTSIHALPSIPSANPAVRTIEFTGSTSFDREILLKQLLFTQVGGEYYPDSLEADIELNLKGFLKEHGFMSCEIRSITDTLPNGDVDVRIEISEGPQYRIGKLEVAAATVFSPDQLITLFDFRKGDIVNFRKIKNALDQLKHMYADNGYISWSYIPEMNLDSSAKTMDLLFTIHEGRQFRTGLIGIVGCGSQDEENEIRALIKLKSGEIFRESDLEASVTAINEIGRYKTMGEKDIEIMPDDKQGFASVVFWVQPQK